MRTQLTKHSNILNGMLKIYITEEYNRGSLNSNGSRYNNEIELYINSRYKTGESCSTVDLYNQVKQLLETLYVEPLKTLKININGGENDSVYAFNKIINCSGIHLSGNNKVISDDIVLEVKE